MSENLGIFKLQNGIESTNLHFTDVGLSPNCNVGRGEKAKSVVVVRSKPSQTAIYETDSVRTEGNLDCNE